MPQQLTETEVQAFTRDGILFPMPVFERDEIGDRLSRLETIETRMAGRLPPAMNVKSHLLIPWLWDMVHDPRIVERVASLLGPDILCWAAGFFSKAGASSDFVAWHQDTTYWGLSSSQALTAWIAFTPSNADNGCMRVVPGRHHRPLSHREHSAAANMLARQEELEEVVNENDAIDVVLAPGEMSLHDGLAVHGSRPNSSGSRRVGFAIRYIAGHLETVGHRSCATLVRGRDHGHFDLEQRPEGEFDAAALAHHGASLRRWMKLVFRDTGQACRPPDRRPTA
jgi:hypothetical protein